MSYDISSFKIQSFRLELPKNFSIRNFSKRAAQWNMEVELDTENNRFKVVGMAEGDVKGIIARDKLVVDHFHIRGDGSGDDWEDIWKPLFKKYGELDAIVLWEGAQELEQIIIRKGNVTEKEFGKK